MSNIESIKAVLDKVAKPYNIFVTNMAWRNERNQRILEIPIMFEDGSMDLETCGIMSEKFIDALDDVKELDFEYFIDVCSPGAERVLNDYQEIKREINQHVYVKLTDPKAGFHEVVGNLSKVTEDHVEVEYMDKTRKKTMRVDTDNINLIRLAVKI